MSDDAVSPKRGKKTKAEKPTEKVESKRLRKEAKPAENGSEEDAPKRGRGRPKGTTKKKSAPKGKGRGRSKKEEKPKESASEESEKNESEDE